MRLLPSILLPISLQENIQTISTADFFKLPLQAGVRPQQQLEDFRRTPSFDYKGAGVAESKRRVGRDDPARGRNGCIALEKNGSSDALMRLPSR